MKQTTAEFLTLTISVLAVAGLTLLNGCKITPEQVKTIAQQSGMFTAVGWIAYDNPDTNEIAVVSSLVDVIKEKSKDIQEGKTYTEVVYPEVVTIIDTKLEPQYRPLAKAATLSFLGGLDLLFATHPEWKADQDIALSVVDSFMDGVKLGLSLDSNNAAIQQARKTAAMRGTVLSSARRNK